MPKLSLEPRCDSAIETILRLTESTCRTVHLTRRDD
jgi:hypothetical protein